MNFKFLLSFLLALCAFTLASPVSEGEGALVQRQIQCGPKSICVALYNGIGGKSKDPQKRDDAACWIGTQYCECRNKCNMHCTQGDPPCSPFGPIGEVDDASKLEAMMQQARQDGFDVDDKSEGAMWNDTAVVSSVHEALRLSDIGKASWSSGISAGYWLS